MEHDRQKAFQTARYHELTCKDLYMCIFTIIIGVLLTMPPTSTKFERSYGRIKRNKNYLEINNEFSLALIHVHKDMNIDVDRVIHLIATDKCRKLDFFKVGYVATFIQILKLDVACFLHVSFIWTHVFLLKNHVVSYKPYNP